MVQSKGLNFKGQNIYVGIDVHLKSWSITILTQSGYKEKIAQQPSAKALYEHLKNKYPNGNYKAVYESGFSGFSTYYALTEYGIDCIVIHAADVPTTQYESVMKTDVIDSEKLAKALKNGSLRSIYIREKDNLDDRGLIRFRKIIQNQLSGYKARVKHLLYNNGVIIPKQFDKKSSHWTRNFMKWLREDVVLLSPTRRSLDALLDQVDLFRNTLLKTTREIRRLSRSEKYARNVELLTSIPGIGPITCMCILTEIDNFKRFNNEKQFASYLGLIPMSHSSGEKLCNGEKTFRGNKQLGPMIIESCWIAIRRDRSLAAAYGEYCKRMKPQEAIIRIARKVSNRILVTIKKDKLYELDRC
jgi:transposase